MIPIETQIFRLIFPPSGSIPLEKLEAVPHIRQHINSIIDLASTEHGVYSPDESAALTARVIELNDDHESLLYAGNFEEYSRSYKKKGA